MDGALTDRAALDKCTVNILCLHHQSHCYQHLLCLVTSASSTDASLSIVLSRTKEENGSVPVPHR